MHATFANYVQIMCILLSSQLTTRWSTSLLFNQFVSAHGKYDRNVVHVQYGWYATKLQMNKLHIQFIPKS